MPFAYLLNVKILKTAEIFLDVKPISAILLGIVKDCDYRQWLKKPCVQVFFSERKAYELSIV